MKYLKPIIFFILLTINGKTYAQSQDTTVLLSFSPDGDTLLSVHDTPDGRYLPDGSWQPRNQNAMMDVPLPYVINEQVAPEDFNDYLSIEWESDKRLSFSGLNCFYTDIDEVQNNYVHVVTSGFPVWKVFYARSTDGGLSWEEGYYLYDEGPTGSHPQIFADSNYVTVVFYNSSNYYCTYSTDYGETWSEWDLILPFGPGAATSHDAIIYIVQSELDPDRTRLHYSTNHGITWQFHSRVNNTSGQVDIGVNSTGYHVFQQGYGYFYDDQEIYYYKNNVGDSTWSEAFMLTDDDGEYSFRPKIIAWDDSNVVACWTDYKYSPYPWTGDILIRRSTDNGESWLDEQQVTTSHLVLGKNLFQRGDSIFLVYDEIVFESTNTEELFFNLSTDGGESWGEPQRLTYADYRSIGASIFVRDARIHVAFTDARDDTIQPSGYRNELYYKRGWLTQTGVFIDDNIPCQFGLKSYPNPFNSICVLTLNGINGHDLKVNIYDITGRLVKTLKMDNNGKTNWDATDDFGQKVSSGLYFAMIKKPLGEKSTKLIYLK